MISGSSRNMILSKIWRRAIKWCNFRFAIDSGRWEKSSILRLWYLMSIFSDYFSVSSTNLHQFKTIFATLCFGGTFDASIGSEDLWSQRRTCSCMYNMYSASMLTCFVYYTYNSKVRLTSQLYMHLVTCTLCLVLCILACSLYNSRFSTLHALGHGFEGGLPWRIPAPCTVHRALCTVHPPGY